jgi:putative ATPase
VEVEDAALSFIAQAAGGDARRALTGLEVAAAAGKGRVDRAAAEEALQQRTLLYDKGGEEHYNVVSAFIKSMRGSDPDAAVYWMARMLEAGEEPRFILRRMVIFASEDVGNADPQALQVAVAALQAFELMGMPEGQFPLTQAVTYLAMAPKSNTALTTYARVREAIIKHGALPTPLHLRNAPTALMKDLGYGRGYQYPHDFTGHHVDETYLPDDLKGARFFQPSDSGAEKAVRERMEALRKARAPREPGEDG